MKLSYILSIMALSGTLGLSAMPGLAEEAEGDWTGVLAGQLHIIVHIKKAADGHYSGSLESPDQGRFVLPIDTVSTDAVHLNFSIDNIHGSYAGRWDSGKQAWEGTWTQGQPLPLELKRRVAGAAPAKISRPQEEAIAAGPRPYCDQAVSFTSPDSQIRLAGTLSVPEDTQKWGKGPFPAVVLVAGSGPNTRDENVFGHKEFVVLADALARNGIAVLRYDKRGSGTSGGDFSKAVIDDFTLDAQAALNFLTTRPEIDARHLGLIGHSEGGLVVPQVANADPKVRFIVMMAGPGIRGDQLLLLQEGAMARAIGVGEADIALMQLQNAQFFGLVVAAPDQAAAMARAQAMVDERLKAGILTKAQAEQTRASVTPWLIAFLRYDPAPALKALKTPLLAVNGTLDTQVPVKEDFDAIRTLTTGQKDVTLVEIPDLNHLFQTARTGSPTEYGEIAETIAPAALTTLTDWVVMHSK